MMHVTRDRKPAERLLKLYSASLRVFLCTVLSKRCRTAASCALCGILY